jgi:tetratricopeptide (TPR) repeat protein
MRRNFFICLLLAAITLAIYWPARHYGMVDYDDPLFLTENEEINSGLNWHSLWWALSGILVANWHPVTSLSFVLGRQFWGTNPGAEHLVNVVFHAANAGLLFLALNRMTRATWRSAAAAALFAWHPLRVESVAWISERKDVLCGFFFLLTLWAYARYAQAQPGAEGRESRAGSGSPALDARRWTPDYCMALIFFALALMSKPMAVTLPFVLLLLDFWPLGRVASDGWRVTSDRNSKSRGSTPWRGEAERSRPDHPLLEKWPFFALTVFFSGLTYWIQKNSAAVIEFGRLGLGDRISNAVSSYLQYLAKLFWPAKLAAIYPFPKSHDPAEIWLAALLLLAVSALCVCQLARRPCLAAGWFWYLGTSVPIIGLVQVGGQAMADRYTYLPLIGPVISLVWLAAEVFQSRRILLSAATAMVLAAFAGLASRQVQFWRNTVVLFEHNIAVTPENAAANYTLGLGLEHAGDTNRAVVCYRVATAIFPGDVEAHKNLAHLFCQQGHWTAAKEECDALLALNPNDAASHLSLAQVAGHFGRADETVFHLNEALRLNPDFVEAMNNLAWTLSASRAANLRNGARAVELAKRACELTHFKKTIYIGTLAAAYAEAGRFDEAMATAQMAIALAQQNGEPDLLQKNQELLERYRRHQTARE